MTLLDRYGADDVGARFLTGIHALVRLPIDQVRRDRARGHHTAAFISGYPGSPVAGVDSELARNHELLESLGIVHQPAVNEELAMTALMGTQQVSAWPGRRVDGVSGWWYGKAPGLERALDALHHANTAGASALGGAVLFVGDDPGAKSSTVPSRSWGLLADLAVPVLTPGSSQEVLDLGRHAVELSRCSGLYVALQVVTAVADGSGDVDVSPGRFTPVPSTPTFRGRPWAAHCEPRLLSTISLGLESELVETRLPAARRYLSDNGFIERVVDPASARVALIAAGHTFRVLRDVMATLGLDDGRLAELGIRLVRLGAVFPLDPASLRRALGGVGEVVVVEDKRPFLELVVRDALYPLADRPAVSGKTDPDGAPLVPADGWLTVDRLLAPLATRLSAAVGEDALDLRAVRRLSRPRLRVVGSTSVSASLPPAASPTGPAAADEPSEVEFPMRSPWYCSGCPHSTGTSHPDGAVVGVGTGCHAMAIITQPDLATFGIAQMGGEGAAWFGLAPFVDTPHAFQNLGDGTLAHSGESAVRGAVAAGVDLTYKLLWNRAVAMTGGQAPVGGHDVATSVARLLSDGVARVIITTPDPEDYRDVTLPGGVEVWHRSRIIEAQEVLAATAGVTVLLHDQECAAELRRGRKRGRRPEMARRVLIAERVCEGCGDCGAKSKCLSVVPVETPFGRKTAIHQTSCNGDESCLEGDCPSFITVTGASGSPVATGAVAPAPLGVDELPEPEPVVPPDDTTIRIPGIGGTGVVTVSQIIAAAAGRAGRHVMTLDHTGLSQKAGPVVSDVRISRSPIAGANVAAAGTVDLYLVFDELVGLVDANLAGCDPATTVAVVSQSPTPTGRMIVDPAVGQPDEATLRDAFERSVGSATFVESEAIVSARFGSTVTTNLFTLGVAFQRGAIPIPGADIEWAVEANGVSVAANIEAFRTGRWWVVDPGRVDTRPVAPAVDPYELRCADLHDYGSASLVDRYRALVDHVRAAEGTLASPGGRFGDVVIVQFHRLLAVKDEYEVARLMLQPDVRAEAETLAGPRAHLTYHLHPPTLRAMGRGRKLAVDERVAVPVFRALRSARRLRGTAFDPFGRTAHRRLERRVADRYEALIRHLADHLDDTNDAVAATVAGAVDVVRGYEQVKERNIGRYREELRRQGLERFAP